MHSQRIFIIGSGVVGAATGEGLLSAGHEVTFIDINPDRLDHLRGLGYDARRELTMRYEQSSFLFLALPTPSDGRRYDLRAFQSGATAVGHALADARGYHTVVVRSTVPPGTTEGLVAETVELLSGKRLGTDLALACAPEFLRAASAVEDFRFPWMSVVASRSARTRERLAELFSPFGGELRSFDNPASAELLKCAHNVFNATKISFWNEMFMLAEQAGLDLGPIAEAVARSAEGSFNPFYGIKGGSPYGGACLPKDTNGLLGFGDSMGVEMPLLDATIRVNESMTKINDSKRGDVRAAS